MNNDQRSPKMQCPDTIDIEQKHEKILGATTSHSNHVLIFEILEKSH